MSPTAGRIREFFARHIKADDLHDRTNIFDAGFVNSLFALQLVLFVEREFGITVDDGDLEISNFCSIEAVERFVTAKRGPIAPAAESLGP